MLLALACAALAAAPAEVPGIRPSDAPKVKKLTLRPAADIVVTAALGVGYLVSEIALKPVLAPLKCRWCVTNDQDVWLSGIRAPLANQPIADWSSHILAFGLIPVLSFGINALIGWQSGASWGEGLWDAWLLLQAAVSAISIYQVVKFSAARERPFVSRLDEDAKPLVPNARDNNVSFFSGHTELAFALTTAAGTIARLRGYKLWWLGWAIGLPLAALTGALRMIADKHWFSDVLIGAAVGATCGYFIPTLFHAREDEGPPRVTVSPLPLGLAVSVRLD